MNQAIKEKEEELVRITLNSLKEMRIKFPGKSDAEAELILEKLIENWKFYKPRVASYWLVKLDSIKRRKVHMLTAHSPCQIDQFELVFLWYQPFASLSL